MDSEQANSLTGKGRLLQLLWAMLFLKGVSSQLVALQTYPVAWAEVPATAPTERNLTSDCICNILNVGCNLGCCCANNCPASVTDLFEEADVCLPSGAEQQTLKFCVPNGFVARVNLPSNGDFYQLPVEQADSSNFFSQLLCITSDRNPNIGKSYPDPPVGPRGDNEKLAQCPAVVPDPAVPESSYLFQSYVFVQRGSSGRRQPLTVPYPAFSSECNDQYVVGFLLPTPAGSRNYYSDCRRNLTALNLTTACSGSGLLTPQYYSQLQFYPNPSSGAGLPFTVVKVQYLNAATGTLTDADAGTSSSYNATLGLCRNAVRYINITMFYTMPAAEGTLQEVQISFILTDAFANNSAFQQSVRVGWIEPPVPVVQFLASGNPGYQIGFPLLAGTMVTENDERSAIQQYVGGMPVAVPGVAGACSPTSLGYIKYGVNTSTSCSVALTAAELESFCRNDNDAPDKFLAAVLSTFYDDILDSNLYLGIWGNSNFSNTNDWIQVTMAGSPSNSTTYSSSDNACIGVITGFDLQIVTGVAFSSNNLQRKVLYANLCLKTSTWDFPDNLATAARNRFYLNFDVSFIPLPQQADKVKKPTPPLVTYLPADIFYPFVISDSAARGLRGSLWLTLLAPVVAVVALMRCRRGQA